MKILVTGSRGWTNKDLMWAGFRQIIDDEAPNIELLHGGASGADQLSGWFAKTLKWQETIVRPDWNKYGKGAGFIRNQQMVDMKPDYALAFWDGSSRGTQDCMRRIEKAKIPLWVVRSDLNAICPPDKVVIINPLFEIKVREVMPSAGR